MAEAPGGDRVPVGRSLTGVGYALVFVYAVRMAGMYAITTTTLLLHAGLLPRWVALLSYLMAAVMLVSTTLHPALLLVFPGWVALAGLIVLVSHRTVRCPDFPEEPTMNTPTGTTTHTDATGPLEDIPGPRALPLLGNAFDIDRADPLGGFVRMAQEYGPIFKIVTPGGMRLLVSGPELVDEVCDDARFDKKVSGGLANLRKGAAGSGLFTSDTDDPLWARAHNILMTPFSLQSMRDYMPKMLDLADQLMDKWSRLNPGEEVDVPADMTRLTLDTIALCGFGYRFNSFYRETPHPFVEAMVRVLAESQTRMQQLPVQTRLRIRAKRQLDEDQAFMNDLVDQIIAERRAGSRGWGRRGRHDRPARPHAHRRRQADRARSCPTRTSARSASPSSSPGTRRPPGCSRSRSTI